MEAAQCTGFGEGFQPGGRSPLKGAVIPAQAGTQSLLCRKAPRLLLDPRLRGDDDGALNSTLMRDCQNPSSPGQCRPFSIPIEYPTR
jgi:hypothetical protein